MRARARLHSDQAGRQLFKEGEKALAPYASLQNVVAPGVDAVDLEYRLREIEPDGCDRHDRLLKLDVTTIPISAIGAEAVHAIKWAVSRRYMSLETLAGICDDPQVRSNAIPAA